MLKPRLFPLLHSLHFSSLLLHPHRPFLFFHHSFLLYFATTLLRSFLCSHLFFHSALPFHHQYLHLNIIHLLLVISSLYSRQHLEASMLTHRQGLTERHPKRRMRIIFSLFYSRAVFRSFFIFLFIHHFHCLYSLSSHSR